MMLWVSWPLNEGPVDRGPWGPWGSEDEKRTGTGAAPARRARQTGRRVADADKAVQVARACPRPPGILPASRDMARIE